MFKKPKVRPSPAIGEDHHCADDASLTIYMINVLVVRAQNLLDNDGVLSKVVRKGDVSDPYCIITIGGASSRTRAIQDDLNPVWNERITFFVARKPATALLQVFDEDLYKSDDLCGMAEFEFHQSGRDLVEDEGTRDAELPLVLQNGQRKGTLGVRVSCRTLRRPPPPPAAAPDPEDDGAELERERRAAQELRDENAWLMRKLRAAEERGDLLEAVERARAPAAVAAAAAAARQTEEDNTAGKELVRRHWPQFRMLKVGVPEEAVVTKFKEEGVPEGEAREIVAGLAKANGRQSVQWDYWGHVVVPELKVVCEAFYIPPVEFGPGGEGSDDEDNEGAGGRPGLQRGASERTELVKTLGNQMVRMAKVIKKQKAALKKARAQIRALERERDRRSAASVGKLEEGGTIEEDREY